jgi:hypothetical protein
MSLKGGWMPEIVFDQVVYGEPGSAKNQRRIVQFGSRPALIKSEKALTYGRVFNEQVKVMDELIEGDLSLRVDVWYASRRPDLACIDFIQDLLQGRIYKNDRQVRASMSVWNLARKDPRCRIQVSRMPIEGLENNSIRFNTDDVFPQFRSDDSE